MSFESEVKSLIPKWLNRQFFEETLRKHYGNDALEVTNYELKSTSANGEGYTSSMYRTKVDFSTSSENENIISEVFAIW